MNNFKAKTKILLIIIVSVFIFIPFFSVLFNSSLNIKESFADYDMSNKNKKTDRVALHGVTGILDTEGNPYSPTANDYLYCPAGEIKCSDGTDTLTAKGTYDINGINVGDTYDYSCGTDGSGQVICDNSLRALGTDEYIFKSGQNQVTLYGPESSETISASSDASLNGFVGPYDYIPLNISGDYVYLYKDDGTGTIDISASPCPLYESVASCNASETTQSAADSPSSIKCLANNGAKIGDPLCCGQDGVLQDTKYNCPSEYPHCIGYKCGETWGKCSETKY